MKKFLYKVSELSGKPVSTISIMSQRQLVDEVILPLIVLPTGQELRGWRISDSFMALMAEYGECCYQQNPFTGEILLEIALQRLSKGAVLHKAASFNVLPGHYNKYNACQDQPGLMSDECWSFLVSQIDVCLRAKLTKEHSTKIVLGLISHLDAEGNELNGYMLAYDCFHTQNKTVYEWAKKIAYENLSFEDVYPTFAVVGRWREFKDYFKKNWEKINEKDFFTRIGESGFFNKRKIKSEILK